MHLDQAKCNCPSARYKPRRRLPAASSEPGLIAALLSLPLALAVAPRPPTAGTYVSAPAAPVLSTAVKNTNGERAENANPRQIVYARPIVRSPMINGLTGTKRQTRRGAGIKRRHISSHQYWAQRQILRGQTLSLSLHNATNCWCALN